MKEMSASQNTKDMRIPQHPILGDQQDCDTVTIFFENTKIVAHAGEPIMAALAAHRVDIFRYTLQGHPRKMFCGIGRCTDCVMIVDGVPGVRTCVTQVREGMRIERQKGAGAWKQGADL